jgi:hypothetical protein
MKTREMTTKYRMSQWAQVLRDRKESGESVKDYCQSRGISRDRYFYWQRKLREAACGQLASIQDTDVNNHLVPSGFAEVKLQQAKWQEAEAGYAQMGGLLAEVSGMRLSVGCTYPVDRLAHLLRELVSL